MPVPDPTIPELVDLVHRYYPRGIESDDPRHGSTEESRRLASVREAAAIACGKQYNAIPDDERIAVEPEVSAVVNALRSWREFGERCRRAFPDCLVWDESGPYFDPGYRYSVNQPGYVHPSDEERDPVFCAFSVLAPVYVIYAYIQGSDPLPDVCYARFPEGHEARVNKLSVLAKEIFGFHRLDEETVRTPVPDVAPFGSNRPMSKTTLMHCLFSSHP